MMETHYQAVKKVLKIAESFVKKYRIYQETDFIWNYTYLLITMVPQSLNLLASADQPLKILLLLNCRQQKKLSWQNRLKNGSMETLRFIL